MAGTPEQVSGTGNAASSGQTRIPQVAQAGVLLVTWASRKRLYLPLIAPLPFSLFLGARAVGPEGQPGGAGQPDAGLLPGALPSLPGELLRPPTRLLDPSAKAPPGSPLSPTSVINRSWSGAIKLLPLQRTTGEQVPVSFTLRSARWAAEDRKPCILRPSQKRTV